MCDDIFSSTEPEKLVLKIQEASSVETNCTMFLSWHCWREKFHEKEKQNKQRMKNQNLYKISKQSTPEESFIFFTTEGTIFSLVYHLQISKLHRRGSLKGFYRTAHQKYG